MNIKKLGKVDYAPTFEAMKTFNAARTPDTEDEIWLVEHPPVFTQAPFTKIGHKYAISTHKGSLKNQIPLFRLPLFHSALSNTTSRRFIAHQSIHQRIKLGNQIRLNMRAQQAQCAIHAARFHFFGTQRIAPVD